MAAQSPRVGIIGGSGWLGSAFARAFLDTGLVAPSALVLSSRAGTGPVAEAVWTRDNQHLAARSEVVLLSVRPEQFGEVEIAAPDALVVSLMAGVGIETLRRRTGARRIVRTMPNAAATIRASYTPWFATPEVGAGDRALVQRLLESCGTADEVAAEADIDYFSGLTGSGPAFPALLAQALIAHARARGLPEATARRAALGVVAGASRLLAAEGAEPGAILDALIGYRGTTAAALETMRAAGFERAVAAGLEAAEARALAMAAATAGRPS